MKSPQQDETPRKPREPLSFDQTAFAVALGVLIANALSGLIASLIYLFIRHN